MDGETGPIRPRPKGRTGAIRLRKIPPEHLLRYRQHVPQLIYVHPNPLVRWVFWGRLRCLLDLAQGGGEVSLDFGCGEGALLPSLATGYRQVIGVDIDIGAAACLVSDYGLDNVSLIRADGRSLPVRSESVDAVFAADVLEHIPDFDAALLEIHRVLRSGGLLLVSAPMEHHFYKLGRRFFRFPAQHDHHHDALRIDLALRGHFEIVKERRHPWRVPRPLAAFLLVQAQKRR